MNVVNVFHVSFFFRVDTARMVILTGMLSTTLIKRIRINVSNVQLLALEHDMKFDIPIFTLGSRPCTFGC